MAERGHRREADRQQGSGWRRARTTDRASVHGPTTRDRRFVDDRLSWVEVVHAANDRTHARGNRSADRRVHAAMLVPRARRSTSRSARCITTGSRQPMTPAASRLARRLRWSGDRLGLSRGIRNSPGLFPPVDDGNRTPSCMLTRLLHDRQQHSPRTPRAEDVRRCPGSRVTPVAGGSGSCGRLAVADASRVPRSSWDVLGRLRTSTCKSQCSETASSAAGVSSRSASGSANASSTSCASSGRGA
jgi:hypothetical protein